MGDFQPQSTNQLPGDTSPDTYRVLQRFRMRVNSTTDWATAGTGFYARKQLDLAQFNIALPPMVEIYYNDGNIRKAPMTIFSSSTGNVTTMCNYDLFTGTKAGGTGILLTINIWSITASQIDLYIQLMSLPAVSGLYPLVT